MDDPFAPLSVFIGKTWRGELASENPEKPDIDISCYERALNGKIVRNLHSVNEGEYGGETIIIWDAEVGALRYFYFTTAGFFTQGTMSFEGERMISSEKVTGNVNGITEVRAVSEIKVDGRLYVRAEYLQRGTWVPGHTAVYQEAAGEQVRFKD